jgi:hypothetical protein
MAGEKFLGLHGFSTMSRYEAFMSGFLPFWMIGRVSTAWQAALRGKITPLTSTKRLCLASATRPLYCGRVLFGCDLLGITLKADCTRALQSCILLASTIRSPPSALPVEDGLIQ